MTSPIANQHHGTCSVNYYLKAIDLLREQVENPQFFFFSDDPDWVRQNIDIGEPYQIITHNWGKEAYQDMQLMSLCNHNIIANSSFSWWGAWLNEHPNKLIVAPKKWFANPSINTEDLIPDSWVRL